MARSQSNLATTLLSGDERVRARQKLGSPGSLLEAETRLAVSALGLDPGLGLGLHTDTEDEGANTEQSDCQAHEDFQLDENPESAHGQLSPGEQSRNQEQVPDRRLDIGSDKHEGVRQNCQHRGRLPQGLEAVHRAKGSPPHENANAPAPTNHCDSAGRYSNGQKCRSQNDIDHIAAESCQGCVCWVHVLKSNDRGRYARRTGSESRSLGGHWATVLLTRISPRGSTGRLNAYFFLPILREISS